MWSCLVNLNEGDDDTSSTSYAIIYIIVALVLALIFGVSNMSTWHDHQKHLQEFKQRENKTLIPETE